MKTDRHFAPAQTQVGSRNLTLILFGACLFGLLAHGLTAQTVHLKIIATTDVHGMIFPYDFKEDEPVNHSLAQVSTYVNKEREVEGQEVILLDNGDILQEQPLIYYYNFEKTSDTHIQAQVMNYMRYDAGTVGNHDIEPGHAVYDKIVKEFKFPWLSANSVNVETGKPYFKPYTVIQRAGVKIVVLGMITPAIPKWLPPNIWEGIRFDDMIETARKWVKIIEAVEEPDLLIGLFHSGVDYTFNNQDAKTIKNENASKLVAQEVAGFDLIMAGHDHQVHNFKTQNRDGRDVLILDGGSRARFVSVADITMKFDKTRLKWKKHIRGSTVSMLPFAPDSAFLHRFDFAAIETRGYVSKRIGTFENSISTRPAIFGNSAFVDLIHTLQLQITQADISLAAPLSFDTRIEQGPIYVRDMFKLYKYENLLYTMELTGREIVDFLEYSYGNWFNHMQSGDDHLLKFKKVSTPEDPPQLATVYFNFDCAAGITYSVDVSKPAGSRVVVSTLSSGKPFSLDRKYKVAVNSYRGNGGGGHLTAGSKIAERDLAGRILSSTTKDLRYFMIKWIEKQGTIKPIPLENWKVIPETWWQKGKNRDYKLLYKD